LVASELGTTSIYHVGLLPDDEILLRVVTSGGLVCGRVCDPGPGFEKPSELSRGLSLAAGGAYLA
jgi:anti-sigma regulatory factor (Ser/Thr protein kinase)